MAEEEQVLDSFLQGNNNEDSSTPAATDEEVVEQFAEEGGNKEEDDKPETDEDGEAGTTSTSNVKQTVKILEKVSQSLGHGRDRVAAFPTPGGIGMLLLAIIVILWTLVPTKSGFTRMQLIWMVLHDQMKLEGAQYPDQAQQALSVPDPNFVQPLVTNPVSLQIAAFSGGLGGLGGGAVPTPLALGVPDFSQQLEI